MACTVADFRVKFPQFSDGVEYTDEAIQAALDEAQCYMGTDENHWCGKYDSAQCYLAAHILAGNVVAEADPIGAGATSGPISNKLAGDVSVTRQITIRPRSEFEEWLIGTIYGQRYLLLRKTCFANVITAGCL